jgi:sugar lactone lactonase YvrE
MILTTAAAVSAFGLLLFFIGQSTDNHGVAIIGAVFIIGVGAAGAVGGYQVAVGEDVDQYTDTREVPLESIDDAVYDGAFSVQDDSRDTTGASVSPDGREIYTTGDRDDVVVWYSIVDYDPTTAVTEHVLDVSAQTTQPDGVSMADDGESLYVVGGSAVHQYELAEPFNTSTATYQATLDLNHSASAATVTGETGLAVSDATNATVIGYDITGGDVTTAQRVSSLDVSNRASDPQGIGFGQNGSQLLVADASQDIIFEYGLAEPYDVNDGVYTGNSLNLDADASYASGVAVDEAGADMVVSSRDGSNLLKYSMTTEEPVNRTQSTTQYEEVDAPNDLPLGVMVLLTGFVLFIGAAGRASES